MHLATSTRLRLLAVLDILRGLFSAACALVVLAVAVLAAVQSVRTIADGTLDSPLFFICLLPMSLAALFAVCVGASVAGFRARKRNLDRIAAISGQQDLLTSSRLEVQTTSAPVLDRQPLTMQIETGLATRTYLTLPYWLCSIAALPLLVVLVVMLVVFGLDLLPLKLLAAVCVVLVALDGPPQRAASSLWGRAARVEADLDGLRWRTLLGGVHTMTWEDAKLVEVRPAPDAMKTAKRVTVLVYGPDAVLRWRDKVAERRYALRRTQPLLDLIAARTGLAACTFDPELAAYQYPGLAPNILRVPGVSNVSYLAQPSRQGDEQPSTPLPSLEAGPYAVLWRQRSTRARIIAGLVGAALTTACLVAGLSLFTTLPLLPHLLADAPQEVTVTIGVIGSLAGFIGFALVLSVVRKERPSYVTATESALTLGHFGQSTAVKWADLLDVVHVSFRGTNIYMTLDHARHAAVVWPGAPLAWTGPVPAGIGRVLNPDDFARLVASRIKSAQESADES